MIRSIFRVLYRVIYGIFAFIGFGLVLLIVYLTIGLHIVGLGPFASHQVSLKHDSVLSLTLNGPYVEHEDSRGFESLLMGQMLRL